MHQNTLLLAFCQNILKKCLYLKAWLFLCFKLSVTHFCRISSTMIISFTTMEYFSTMEFFQCIFFLSKIKSKRVNCCMKACTHSIHFDSIALKEAVIEGI